MSTAPSQPATERWKTPLSDLDVVHFVSIVDAGTILTLTVRDDEGVSYEVRADPPTSYRFIDHLLDYEVPFVAGRGRTFMVTGFNWMGETILRETIRPEGKLYVIQTDDGYLELLLDKPPTIHTFR